MHGFGLTSTGGPMKINSIFFAICFTVLSSLPFSWAISRSMLLIRAHDDRHIFFQMNLPYGDTFTLRYIHSVDHAPVFEVFRAVKGKGLVLVETYFQMFGAGMGHWEGHGKIVQDGRWTKVKDINQPLGSFLLRVGTPGVDHTILYHGDEWNLSEKAAGLLVEVMIAEKDYRTAQDTK